METIKLSMKRESTDGASEANAEFGDQKVSKAVPGSCPDLRTQSHHT